MIAQKKDTSNAYFRQLEFIKKKVYNVLYPGLVYNKFNPSREGGPWIDTITYRIWDTIGMSKFIDGYDTGLPNVSATGTEKTVKIREIGNKMEYSYIDLQKSKQTGQPLSKTLAMASKRANEQKLEEIFFEGDSTRGVSGLLSHDNTTTATASGTPITGSSATAASMLAELNACYRAIITNSKGVHIPDTLVMSETVEEILKSTRNSDSSDKSVLDYFMDTHKSIKSVIISPRMKSTVRPSGSSTEAEIICMLENSSDILQYFLPMPYTIMGDSTSYKDMIISTPTMSRVGGLVIYYPLAVSFREAV